MDQIILPHLVERQVRQVIVERLNLVKKKIKNFNKYKKIDLIMDVQFTEHVSIIKNLSSFFRLIYSFQTHRRR